MNLLSPQIPQELIDKLCVPQIIDIRDQLPVNPNYSWEELTGNRDPNALNTIVCHHDVYPKYTRVNVSDIDLAIEIAEDHIDNKQNHAKGDPGFPYEIWIRNGKAYLCNDILPLKYCVASNNTYTLNVCVSGDYKYHDALTDQDRNMLYAVLLMWKWSVTSFNAIRGHGEIQPKYCPGYDIDRVRNDVADIEMRIALSKDRQVRLDKMAVAARRVVDLYNRANDPNFAWMDTALEKGDKIVSFLEREDLMNP